MPVGLFTDTHLRTLCVGCESEETPPTPKTRKTSWRSRQTETPCFPTSSSNHLLANVQSLDNKLCELRARISYQRETRDCCVICLTETWMSAMVPDSAIELTGFSVHRVGQNGRAHREKQRRGCLLLHQQLMV